MTKDDLNKKRDDKFFLLFQKENYKHKRTNIV